MSTFQRLVGVTLIGIALHPAADAVDLSQYGDLESRHRSKIVKMKAKQSATTSQNFNFLDREGDGSQEQCGSQSIGNVGGTGRAGPRPREIFVFAPGAINVVSGSGCR